MNGQLGFADLLAIYQKNKNNAIRLIDFGVVMYD